METFAQRLRRLRVSRGLSVNRFARLVGKDPGGISRIENGKRLVGTLPAYHEMVRWADVLGVPVGVLAGDEEAPEPFATTRPGWLDAPLGDLLGGLGAELVEDIEFDMKASAGTGRKQPKSNRVRPRKPHYVIEVEGDCMVPEIQNGDAVHFDPSLDPQHGDWVVATTDGDNAIVKKLVVKGGVSQQLLPLNGEPLTIDENVRILGVVISYERPGPRGRRKAR